jgi:hypothetical protein
MKKLVYCLTAPLLLGALVSSAGLAEPAATSDWIPVEGITCYSTKYKPIYQVVGFSPRWPGDEFGRCTFKSGKPYGTTTYLTYPAYSATFKGWSHVVYSTGYGRCHYCPKRGGWFALCAKYNPSYPHKTVNCYIQLSRDTKIDSQGVPVPPPGATSTPVPFVVTPLSNPPTPLTVPDAPATDLLVVPPAQASSTTSPTSFVTPNQIAPAEAGAAPLGSNTFGAPSQSWNYKPFKCKCNKGKCGGKCITK